MASGWVKFRDTVEAIVGFGLKYIFPILSAIVPILKVPAWVGTVVGSVVPNLMAIAEQEFPAPGSGPMKKEKVLNVTEKLMALMESEFTGGAAGTFAKIKPTLEVLIDRTITAINDLDKSIIADDIPGPSAEKSGIKAPVDTP